MTRSLLVIFLLVFLCLSISKAQSFAFLQNKPGIKGNAMGGAQAALVNGYEAFYYNPAGLAKIKKTALGYSKIDYKLFNSDEFNFKYSRTFVGAAVKVSNGVLGLSFDSFEFNPWSFKQNNYQLSYALPIKENVYLGLSFKYLRQTVDTNGTDDISGSGHTGDIGVLFENLWPYSTFPRSEKLHKTQFAKFKGRDPKGISIGIALQNTGPDEVEYRIFGGENYSEPLPQNLNLGIGYYILQTDFLSATFALDLTKYLIRQTGPKPDFFMKAWFTSWKDHGIDKIHSGIDLNICHLASLYLGYENFRTLDVVDKNGFTYGFSIGPDYARLEAFYRIYPLYLTDGRDKEWQFGFSLNY